MDKIETDNTKINRRSAFRIYERADLFYHKIEFTQERGERLNFSNITEYVVQSPSSGNSPSSTNSSFEPVLPDSYGMENDALNVNISSTGISFTSQEELERGDYLVIRILLLSSMTVVMTCCKVVYVKPSNPYEKNQYPYLVGARFVNLKQEHKELLDKHISKKRVRRFTVIGLVFCLVMIVIQVPDLVFDLFLDLCSFLFETTMDLFHLLYECIEYTLDLVIEHVFHTSVQNTQTIVFYIQVVLAVAISYPLFISISSACKNLFYYYRLFYSRKKSSLLYCWGEQALLNKIGIAGIGISIIIILGLSLI